jgi:hypothetical protein
MILASTAREINLRAKFQRGFEFFDMLETTLITKISQRDRSGFTH